MVSGGNTIDPSSRSDQDISLTIVIPCFNEEERLPSTLDTVLGYLSQQDYTWELIIADDGSVDETPEIARRAATQENVLHLRLPHQGKAAAVRAGFEAARGAAIVFTDADLSTPIEYVTAVRELTLEGWDLVIGTREGKGARRVDEPTYRHFMGRLFNYLVQLMLVRGVRDTQCGFKAFRADAARDLFARTQLYRGDGKEIRGPLVTGFDVELLFLARKFGYRLYELPVTWRHAEGSKVRPGLDSLYMVRDLLRVRLNDMRGRYDAVPPQEFNPQIGSTER